MNAATSPARLPLFEEGKQYWEQLISECRRQATDINSAICQRGLSDGDGIQCESGTGLHIMRSSVPSTEIQARMEFRPWGPVIDGFITGHEAEDLKFFPEEFEITIAKDLDGTVVAIFDEGRSLSPQELAAYLTQHFRRCFPGISLPCPK